MAEATRCKGLKRLLLPGANAGEAASVGAVEAYDLTNLRQAVDFLSEIPDPPPALFVDDHLPQAPTVAIVGSRKASPTGLRVARELGRALGERGVCVVSGLALGIDAASHQGALDGGGPTADVLACGVDVANAPLTNRKIVKLQTRISCGADDLIISDQEVTRRPQS